MSQSRLRIAFFAPMKPINHPEPSGDREIARGLYDYFQSQGAEVLVYSQLRLREFWRRPQVLWSLLWSWPKTLWLLWRFQPDVFFTYHSYYKVPDVLGWSLSRVMRKSHFLFEAMHSERPATDPQWRKGYLWNRRVLMASEHIFTDKSDDLLGLQKLWPEAEWPERMTLILPSLAWRDFKNKLATSSAVELSRPRLTVICVAMLRRGRKTEGVKFLLRAVQQLFGEGLDFDLQIVGGGTCLPEIRELAKTIDHRIFVLGEKSKAEILNLLGAADIFAFPGIDEGFGLVYLEAQASALPVVAFDNGGIPEAVANGESGWLTPLNDQPAYCEALRKLLLDSTLRAKMGECGQRRIASQFDRDKNYSQIIVRLQRNRS